METKESAGGPTAAVQALSRREFGATCAAGLFALRQPAVITIGTTNCTVETPRLPRPALMASAFPFSAFGKKKEMLAMEEAKLPPPKPHNRASDRNSQ